LELNKTKSAVQKKLFKTKYFVKNTGKNTKKDRDIYATFAVVHSVAPVGSNKLAAVEGLFIPFIASQGGAGGLPRP
jgi:hypothetical protein